MSSAALLPYPQFTAKPSKRDGGGQGRGRGRGNGRSRNKRGGGGLKRGKEVGVDDVLSSSVDVSG